MLKEGPTESLHHMTTKPISLTSNPLVRNNKLKRFVLVGCIKQSRAYSIEKSIAIKIPMSNGTTWEIFRLELAAADLQKLVVTATKMITSKARNSLFEYLVNVSNLLDFIRTL